MIKINSYYLITFAILICFPCFVVPLGSKLLLVASIFMISSFFLAIIFSYKNFLNNIKEFCVNYYTRLFIAFILWAIFSGIILIMFGKVTIKNTFSHIAFGLIYSVTFPLFFGFFISKKITIDKIMKVLSISLYIILTIGLINFLIFYFNIDILEQIYSFFVNIQTIRESIDARDIRLLGFPRVKSVFYEPGVYSYFLALFFPFICYFSQAKYKCVSSNMIRILMQKTFMPLAWFNVIFSFSPIGIIMSFISFGIYKLSLTKNYAKLLKNVLKIFVSFMIIISLIYIFREISIINAIYKRIFSVQYIFTNFQEFVYIEESLATRLVYYINCTIIGFKNILFGAGWGSLGLALKTQLLNSPVPLTSENVFVYFTKGLDTTSYVLSIAYAIFGATGLLGFIFFYSFIFRLIKKLFSMKKLNIRYSNLFFVYLILFVIYSFYESPMYYQYYWLIIGIIVAYINKNQYTKLIKINKEELCR